MKCKNCSMPFLIARRPFCPACWSRLSPEFRSRILTAMNLPPTKINMAVRRAVFASANATLRTP